jgi:hypothetical protein
MGWRLNLKVGARPVTLGFGAVRRAAERTPWLQPHELSGAGHDACWINRVAPTAMW